MKAGGKSKGAERGVFTICAQAPVPVKGVPRSGWAANGIARVKHNVGASFGPQVLITLDGQITRILQMGDVPQTEEG